jgi:hypothetical protein
VTFIQGLISYRTGTPEAQGPWFGREHFSVSLFDDGTRTLRAVCEFEDVGLVRDVTYTLDAAFRPVEAYVKVAYRSRPVGSGWFRFTATSAEGEAFTAAEGRMRQHFDLTEPVRAFGTHPICSDMLRLAHLRTDGVGEEQTLAHCMNSSGLSYGESGPILSPRSYVYVYDGAERMATEAGTFDTHAFTWKVRAGKTLRLWTLKPHHLPVRLFFPEGRKIYDLVSLSVRD